MRLTDKRIALLRTHLPDDIHIEILCSQANPDLRKTYSICLYFFDRSKWVVIRNKLEKCWSLSPSNTEFLPDEMPITAGDVGPFVKLRHAMAVFHMFNTVNISPIDHWSSNYETRRRQTSNGVND